MTRHLDQHAEPHRFGGQRGTGRRALLMMVGGGAGAAAWAISAHRASAAPVADDAVEAAVAEYFRARVDAANSRRTAPLRARIDPANASLRESETERSGYLSALGSARRWNGRMRGFATSPGILSTRTSGTTATVRVYEELGIRWHPTPQALSPAELRAARRDPQRFGLDQPADALVSSGVGVAHELTLDRGASGWVVTSDAYVEDLFLGRSPDAPRSPWAVSMDLRRPNGGLHGQGPVPRTPPSAPVPPPSAPMPSTSPAAAASPTATATDTATATATVTAAPKVLAASSGSRLYSWSKAVAYAGKYWSSYNSAYPNYNPCGGDCANFVSQCLRAGGETADGTWYTHGGTGCQRYSANAGSTAWVNNWGLRNWSLNTHRAISVYTVRQLGRGDIINYDWTGNGTFDHVAIITNSASMLVTAHNTNHRNVPWSMGAKAHRFTWILGHF